MSHLLSLAQGGVLPSVKCSNCGKSVSLGMLSDHVCQQPPARTPSQSGLSERRGRSHKPQTPIILPTTTPPSPFPSPLPRSVDYPPIGKGGFAGVGRRAFLAVPDPPPAQQRRPYHEEPQNGHSGPLSGMQGRWPFQPQYLDTAGAAERGTPPLSPNSALSSPRSHSPHTPFSHFPINNKPVIAKSRTPPPGPPRALMPATRSRSLSNASRSPPTRDIIPPVPPAPSSLLPFFQKYKDGLGQNQSNQSAPAPKDNARYPRPLSPSDSEYSSLPYVNGHDNDNDHFSPKSPSNHSTISTVPFVRDERHSASPRRSHTQPTTGPRGGSGGDASPLGTASQLRMGATRSASDARETRLGKGKELASRLRVCARCEIKIENGRWVKMDSGKNVLCERCWKSMYLPKCQRCERPIEEAAISSSDGQLKGKYHRECFTCSTCRKPFSDESFYVYDGRPMCAFHYHQANRSLCVAPTCGRPIEGPCAMTYAGDRYHPQCLRCGHRGCDERLEDYWEVDGMMLCERHAPRYEHPQGGPGGGWAGEEQDGIGALGQFSNQARPRFGVGVVVSRGQKRTTQLINLTGAGFNRF